MANYTYNADLIDDVLTRCGEETGTASSQYNSVVRYVNRAYQILWRGGGEFLPELSEQWWWLTKYNSGVLTLLPVFDNNTVQVTNNSTTITFSSAPQRSAANISVQGWHFKVNDHPDVFYISSHTSGNTNATLDSVYTGENDTAADFRAFKLDYSLASDVMELTGPMHAYQGGLSGNKIESITPDLLKDKWPLEQAGPGVPMNFARIGVDSSQYQLVRFSHYGGQADTELIRIDYNYIATPTDISDSGSQTNLVPREYRHLIADMATFFLMQDKEDSRAQSVFEMSARGLRQMAEENRRYHSRTAPATFGRIYPRLDARARLKGPLRTESGDIIGW